MFVVRVVFVYAVVGVIVGWVTEGTAVIVTLPLVTVPMVVMFPCVKCSFALYPVVDDNVICAELDTISWLSNCCLTSATQPVVWSALICPEPDTIPVPK